MISIKIGETTYFMFKINKENFKNITIIILLLLLIIGGSYYAYRTNKISAEKETSDKLNASLTDTLRVVKQDNGLLRYEKLAIQEDIKKLEDGNITLSNEKKELLSEVKKLNKEKDVFAATVIKQRVQIDSFQNITSNGEFIDSTTVAFEKKDNDTINYKINVYNVSKVVGKKPLFNLYSLDIPNTQTIAFGWDKNKRNNYPVSVSIINTNPLFKTYNVEAYAIPELTKETVDPTFWMKFKKGFKETKNKGLLVGGGIVLGFFLGSK